MNILNEIRGLLHEIFVGSIIFIKYTVRQDGQIYSLTLNLKKSQTLKISLEIFIIAPRQKNVYIYIYNINTKNTKQAVKFI